MARLALGGPTAQRLAIICIATALADQQPLQQVPSAPLRFASALLVLRQLVGDGGKQLGTHEGGDGDGEGSGDEEGDEDEAGGGDESPQQS